MEEWIRQLNRRIDEHHEYLRERLDDLTSAVQAMHQDVQEQFELHESYHRLNEHRWGLLKLAGRHPFRLAFGLAALAWALALHSPADFALLAEWARRLLLFLK